MTGFLDACLTGRRWRDAGTTVTLLNDGHYLRSAVTHVVEEVDRVEEECLVLRRRFLAGPAGGYPGIAAYADALGWMIAGNLEWSCITTRYHGDGHAWNGEYATVVGPAPQHRLV